jgi:tetratricopeptide (TPR) repeat protein
MPHLIAAVCLALFAIHVSGALASQKRTGGLKVVTDRAGSVVFINNIRHGVTREDGVLDMPEVWAGSYPMRVRTAGFLDWTGRVIIAAGSARTVKVVQRPETDPALLHYQRAEDLRDRGKNADAVKEYEAALALRPSLTEARIGITRSLITLQVFDKAEDQIQAALRGAGARTAEARTVLANMRRSQGLIDEAIVEYRRALRAARGISPEYRAGIAQDMDTEPILYYLLGSALEKERRNKEAIEAYGHYLRLDPEGQYASAIQSLIDRLKEEPAASSRP